MVNKYLGILICIIGSILAILFVPISEWWGGGWHFIRECETEFGETICAYQIIDTSALILELILINGIGIAIYYLGSRR